MNDPAQAAYERAVADLARLAEVDRRKLWPHQLALHNWREIRAHRRLQQAEAARDAAAAK